MARVSPVPLYGIPKGGQGADLTHRSRDKGECIEKHPFSCQLLFALPPSCREREVVKVPAEELRGRVVYIVAHKRIAQDFSHASEFLTLPPSPARIPDGQIKKLESAMERFCRELNIVLAPPAHHTLYLASNVAKLLHQTEAIPALNKRLIAESRHGSVYDKLVDQIDNRLPGCFVFHGP